MPLAWSALSFSIAGAKHESHSVIGAATIPKRHAILKAEDFRILDT